jgi:hypothetical protein
MFIRAYTAAPLAGPARPFTEPKIDYGRTWVSFTGLRPKRPSFDPGFVAAVSALIQALCAIIQLLR